MRSAEPSGARRSRATAHAWATQRPHSRRRAGARRAGARAPAARSGLVRHLRCLTPLAGRRARPPSAPTPRPPRSLATCSGFVAPAITDTTGSTASSPPIATSSSERPCASAHARSASTRVEIRGRDLAPVQPRARRRRRVARDLSGEEPAREREVRDEPEPEPRAGRQQLGLGVAAQQRVLALLRDERVRRKRADALECLGPVVRRPPRPDRFRSATSCSTVATVSSSGVCGSSS